MTNSPLVVYKRISPNHSGLRTHKIDTITPHCVVGHLSLETLGNVFAPASRQASSNYGIDDNGRVGMYCEEKNRFWCSSSNANDQRAVTIEVASDKTHPFKITDGATQGLIDLCADICQRNEIPKLLWQANKALIGQVDKQNITVHLNQVYTIVEEANGPGASKWGRLKSGAGWISLDFVKKMR